MDKSDLLEEWDVVSVSSVYETEKESTDSDTKIVEAEKENTDSDTNIVEAEKENTDSDTSIVEAEKENTDSVTNILEAEKENTDSDTNIVKAEKENIDSDIKIEETETEKRDSKIDFDIVKNNGDSNVDIAANISTASANVESEAVVELESKMSPEPEDDTLSEPKNEIEMQGTIDTEPGRNMPAESEYNIQPDFETDIKTTQEINTAASDLESVVRAQSQSDIRVQPEIDVIFTEDTDLKTDVISDVKAEEKTNIDIHHVAEALELNIDDDNIVEDIVHVSNPVYSNPDSSLMTSETASEEFDIQDTPELVPEQIQIEQEMAAIESSSSDIDIIDETVEDSITSSFISPLSLSISSSVADASSIHSFTSQSDDGQVHKPKETTEYTVQEKIAKKSESTEKIGLKHEVPTHCGDKSENSRSHRHESQRTTNRKSPFDWFFLLLELFRNMSGYDWCIIGGVAVSLYLTVVINQTNIFAVVQKENVVSQMKDMMNELKNDNKMLKEQMLSELKNKKALSSFEYQIRELRKENSKLNHMLYDVAKVLDKQKNSREKKEADYMAPFKNEINKLKEHINILKFDNEELQKELVRMRYGSFAQGVSESVESKDQPGKKGNTKSEGDASAEEIPPDFESLKKWNELITLLTQELGSLSGEGFKNENPHSDSINKDSKPFWKAFFTDFKGTFNDLRKINFTAMLSDYRKANQKAISDIYKFVKDFFSVAEHTQVYTSNEDGLQWKNIGDFVSDLKDKWTNIKDRLYTSDLKQFFEKHFKKAAESGSEESSSQKVVDAESRTTSAHFKSENKHDQVQTPEETKWMFKRAAHREELRNAEEEVNWYLKKGRHHSDDENKERHF